MIPSPDFRAALPSDAYAIRDLVRAAYARWVPVIGREPLPMQADYAQALREHRIDLLYRDDSLAGLIETMPRADHLWIENVAVAPAFQGAGLGRRLLAHAASAARAEGLGELRLLTNAAFEANLALYRKLGFTVTREAPFRGGTTVHMAMPVEGFTAPALAPPKPPC